MSTTYVIYHAGCMDGFGAAWAAHRALGDKGVRYVPSQYGPSQYEQEPPAMESSSRIYILDFSYSLKTMTKLASEHQITLLDHHKSAALELDGKIEGCIFDMSRSGAVMAWEHFHPKMDVPILLQYVQDRDLWQWELRESKAINAALEAYEKSFAVWNGLETRMNNDNLCQKESALLSEGHALLRREELTVKKLVSMAGTKRIAGHTVPAVNSPVMVSETGHALLEKFPEAPFAAVYSDAGDGTTRYSLRSRPGFDVSEIAGKMGGGGHATAAGFTQIA